VNESTSSQGGPHFHDVGRAPSPYALTTSSATLAPSHLLALPPSPAPHQPQPNTHSHPRMSVLAWGCDIIFVNRPGTSANTTSANFCTDCWTTPTNTPLRTPPLLDPTAAMDTSSLWNLDTGHSGICSLYITSTIATTHLEAPHCSVAKCWTWAHSFIVLPRHRPARSVRRFRQQDFRRDFLPLSKWFGDGDLRA
jgi:hypothetical protein